MKVAHVITRLVVGGAQENTIATVAGLRDKPGCKVSLIAGLSPGAEGSLESSVRAAKIDLTIVPTLVRAVHPLKDFLALQQLTKLFREQKPDIVHTHSGKAGVLGRMAAKRAGVPLIIHTIHGPSFGNFQGALANWIFTAAEKYAARSTDHFVVVAEAMKTKYLGAGIGRPGQYTKIFSGFPLESFLAAKNDLALRARLGFAPEDFIIGKVARLVPLKGHAELVIALGKILPECSRARLVFVGNGPLRAQLESRIKDLGLTDKIVFTGLVPPAEVSRYIGIMDCLAHLSAFPEGLPRAMPQALAAGKPVVAYDFEGAEEVCVENSTGFLIRSGDTNAAAGRLLQLAHDAALRERLGLNGRQLVIGSFAVEKMVDDIFALYHRLAKPHGVRAAS